MKGIDRDCSNCHSICLEELKKITKDLKSYSRSVSLGVFLGYSLVHGHASRF